MLPNLNQHMGGNPYLISLDDNIMRFWFQYQLCPWCLYIWNLSPNQSKVTQLSSIWFITYPVKDQSLIYTIWNIIISFTLIFFYLKISIKDRNSFWPLLFRPKKYVHIDEICHPLYFNTMYGAFYHPQLYIYSE